jgi:hypothetical protein
MKTLILAAIRCSLMFTAVTASLICIRPAQAYTVTLEQVGSNVVANGSGAIDLTGLTFFSAHPNVAFISAAVGVMNTGLAGNSFPFRYARATGPTSFGSGGQFIANTSSGDLVGIAANAGPAGDEFGVITVPQGYVSGTALSSSSTWNNATFASLGLAPNNTYVWTWGTGLENQNFTLQIGAAGVPDGGSTVSLLACALVGLAGLRRKLSC